MHSPRTQLGYAVRDGLPFVFVTPGVKTGHQLIRHSREGGPRVTPPLDHRLRSPGVEPHSLTGCPLFKPGAGSGPPLPAGVTSYALIGEGK
jgi:hypothetical protein